MRARELYARSGGFAEAAAIAHHQGDELAELSFALRLPDRPRVPLLLAALKSAPAAQRRQAAEVCEAARALREAAELRLSLDDVDAALALLRRADDLLGCARLEEARGKWQQAIFDYQHYLASRSPSAASAGLRDERIAAHRSCARLLGWRGEVEAALVQLQAARRLLLPPRPDDAAALQGVEAELIEVLLLLDEPELALRLFGQHAAWCGAARRVRGPVEYVQGRALLGSGPSASAPAEAALFLRRYRLGPLLGSGSVGRVYLAEDLFSGRRVALKLLTLAQASSTAGSQLYARFCREATLLARLRHPRLLRIESFHAAAGALALEYMAGGAASQLPRPLSLAQLRRLLLDILDALAAMHAAGVLHRDIKPHNLFLDELGGAKLGDFGTATLQDLGVTQTEGLIGTLAYMAPEQLRSTTLSVATDIYGLAVTAFELLTGRLPFTGPDFISQHLHAAVPDARQHRPEVPLEWAILLRRLLHKDPQLRMPSLERLRAEVAALPTDEAHRGHPASERASQSALAAPPPPGLAPRQPPPATASHRQPPAAQRLLRTPHSEIFVTSDPRLSRTVVVERFAPGLLQSPAGAAQLRWLRQLAAVAGPGLQRVFHIRLSSSDGPSLLATAAEPEVAPTSGSWPAEVCYEYVAASEVVDPAQATPEEKQQLRRLLSRLHQAGVAHGAVARSVVREPAQLCLLLQGCGPLHGSPALHDAAESAASSLAPIDAESDLFALR